MIVPTYVGPSAIEGIGIFAVSPIERGAAIWSLDERYDLLLTPADLETMGPLQRDFVERYGYPHMTRPGLTVVEFDNGRFMNHADLPNTDFTDPRTGWAIRDIAAGEEITCNYAEFDPGFVMQPGRVFAAQAAAMAGISAGI
ncbi:SET domain-containing protein-lysine N-methyltransferase [Altererythrobacter sp. B11]|nr:SET domain-containing protein-lysine N-methyltransferase [Altererythrobacter sp. B11]